MKKIVKLIFIICISAVILPITGCGTKKIESAQISIITTNFPGYDFARAVGKNHVDITMLLKPGSESHSYDPTIQDIAKIEACDIFIYTGGESDEWVHDILDSIDTSNIKIIRMMDLVEVVKEEHVEGMQKSHDEHNQSHEHEGEYDEHVWTSPLNSITIVKKIKDTLISINEENIEYYETNANSYIEQLNSLDREVRDIVANGKRTELVFADRFPFRYFVEEYGLTYRAAFPGCSSNTEANAKTIAYLIDYVKDNAIPVVFNLELSNQKIADVIIEDTNSKKLEFHSIHNVTKKQFESGITYVELMQQNIKNLKEALN